MLPEGVKWSVEYPRPMRHVWPHGKGVVLDLGEHGVLTEHDDLFGDAFES